MSCYLPQYWDTRTLSCESCPLGQHFNTTVAACVTCPSGYIFDPTRYICYLNTQCEMQGQIYNSVMNRCECPSTYPYENLRLKKCEACESPRYWDYSKSACLTPTVDIKCPLYSTYNNYTQKCECPNDKPYLNGQECLSCEAPRYWNQTSQVCSQCGEGEIYNQNLQICEKCPLNAPI